LIDLSTGPTSLIGLLTADVVEDLTKEGYTEQAVASAVALMMGVYGMLLGFLKLGFILDFISIPTLTGFISAAAITIGLGQIANLVSYYLISLVPMFSERRADLYPLTRLANKMLAPGLRPSSTTCSQTLEHAMAEPQALGLPALSC